LSQVLFSFLLYFFQGKNIFSLLPQGWPQTTWGNHPTYGLPYNWYYKSISPCLVYWLG
jgi:hypothetical protein